MTLQKLKKAACAYIDEEFTSKMQGAEKWLIGIGANAYLGKLDELLTNNIDTLVCMGFCTQDGNIEIDVVYSAFHEQATKHGAITQKIPMIGDVKFDVADIEKLYKLCKEVS